MSLTGNDKEGGSSKCPVKRKLISIAGVANFKKENSDLIKTPTEHKQAFINLLLLFFDVLSS